MLGGVHVASDRGGEGTQMPTLFCMPSRMHYSALSARAISSPLPDSDPQWKDAKQYAATFPAVWPGWRTSAGFES